MPSPNPISDAVYEVLFNDFVNFHLVFAFGSAIFSITLLMVGVLCFDELSRSRSDRHHPSTRFEHRACSVFAGASLAFGLVWALLAVVNLTTVVEPGPGLANMLTAVGSDGRSQTSDFDRAVDAWLPSETPAPPRVVSEAVDRRLAWQRPKAMISGFALVCLAVATSGLWRRLTASARRTQVATGPRSTLTGWAVYLAAPALFAAMVLTLANTQACLAPLLLTLSAG